MLDSECCIPMSSPRKRICVLTGTRAEYGLLRSLMRAVEAHPRLELQTLVTGTHLVKDFGHSVDQIRRDGFRISTRIPMYRSAADLRKDLPGALARLVDGAGRWMLDHRSDWIVVLGDRVEALGGALAGLTANIPVAHLHGGELAQGDMDDRIRFAISALATLHFVATAEARRRLIRTGEPPDRIHVVGAMALDELVGARRRFEADPAGRSDFWRRRGLPADGPHVLVVYHPCGFGSDREHRHMKTILQILRPRTGLIVGCNNDPGHSGVRRATREFLDGLGPEARVRWQFVENLNRDDFLRALWAADALVGNSSSGILEANALGTTVVNIGPRQAGRQRNGNAVFDCAYSAAAIRSALAQAAAFGRTHKIRSRRAFGTGRAGEKIAAVLSRMISDRALLVKPRL